MYTMKADGVLFHNPAANDPSRMAMSTEAKFELNKAGSLTFTLPPDNVVYHSLKKRKSVVQLYQDGEMLFQGRVIDMVSDLQNMQEVYCEGDLNLLLDSVQPAMDFDGTAEEYLRQAIRNHNAVMEADKQFVVGTVTAVEEKHKVKVKSTDYTDTLGDLRSLLVDEFGGYLRVRYSGSTRYLDYIKEYTEYSGQSVKFGVNLVDIEKRVDTQKFFTILLPLGKIENGARTTIAQVNGGSIYLEDVAAVSQYGRIIRTVTFEKVNDPQELLEKAQEYLARMRENRSVTVRAVDMKIVNPDTDSILLGDWVMLDSLPHDLNEYDICAKVVLLIDAPDQSEYTFGIPPDPLTDQVASRIKQTNKSVDNLKDWLTVTDTELILAKQHIADNGNKISNVMIELDAVNATILLKADQTVVSDLETRVSNAEILIDGANAAIDLKADRTTVTELETRMSAAEILIDGANAKIDLKAAQSTVDDLGERLSQAEILIDGLEAEIKLIATQASIDELTKRLSQAEIDIDGANAQINLKASQSTVDALGERVSSAEIKIDGANSSIELLAEEIRLAGYVTADAFETETLKVVEGATLASLKTGAFNCSGRATVNEIWATGGVITNLNVPNIIIAGTSFDPADYATKEWVEDQGYLKSANLSNYATQSWVIERNYTTASDVAQTLDGYVMQGELDGYATEAWVRENFSKASATYKPTVIERYGSVSGTSIPVRALNESGTVLLTGTVAAGDVYTSGYNAAKVKDLTIGTPSYYASSKVYAFSVTAIATDGTTKQEYFGLDATAAYDSGYAAGQSAGGGNSGSYNDGYNAGYADAKPSRLTYGSPSYISSSKQYSLTVNAVSADGTPNEFYVYVDATAAYNAGYAAGQAAGGSSTPDIELVWTVGDGENEYAVMAVDKNTGAVLATTTNDFTNIYNKGWNACRDACTSQKVLINYYQAGENLYDADGYLATGPWYKGKEAYRYNRPAAKS